MNIAKIAIACRAIGNGFLALADAVEEPDVASEAPTEKPKAEEKPKPGSEDSGDPVDDQVDDVEEVTLEDLQELGASLLKAKKRDKFVGVLNDFGLKNLSSANEKDYKAIWEKLKVAGE